MENKKKFKKCPDGMVEIFEYKDVASIFRGTKVVKKEKVLVGYQPSVAVQNKSSNSSDDPYAKFRKGPKLSRSEINSIKNAIRTKEKLTKKPSPIRHITNTIKDIPSKVQIKRGDSPYTANSMRSKCLVCKKPTVPGASYCYSHQ
jgi:hypothetical protein